MRTGPGRSSSGRPAAAHEPYGDLAHGARGGNAQRRYGQAAHGTCGGETLMHDTVAWPTIKTAQAQ